MYFTLFTLPQKRTNINCCTAALAVCLLLFSASYTCTALVRRLGHATGGARVLIWIYCGLWQQLVATWAKFQHSVVYNATDQCWKRLEACINAEGGDSEHLQWHCLPDILVATHHNRFFSEPPTTTHNWLFSEPPVFEQEAQLSPIDRAMRLVSSNLANYHTTVQKLLIRKVLTKPMVWSWKFSW